MVSFQAESVDVPDETDRSYGEGWLSFQWADPLYGREGLTIQLDGHCSRNMPIRSGNGPPDFVDLKRDRVTLRFDPVLAKELELDEEIEIRFALTDEAFYQLQRTIDYFNGVDDIETDSAPDRGGR
jgi:hypothetical protein